jgi:type I restriction enzyme S subunit
MLSRDTISLVDSSTYGVKMPRANWDFIGNLPMSLPPLPEQKAIAAFLDRETERIDSLIEKKKKQIDLLQRKRTALISQAVTKGLDPKAKMKDSGVEWFATMPSHWTTKRMKYIASLKSGESITSDSIYPEGEFPVFGGNGLRGYALAYTHDGYYILIGRQGALCGNINYAKGRFWASEHAVVATLEHGYDTFWFGEVLNTMNLNQYSISAAQPGLSVDSIKQLLMPIPPLIEQQSIATYFRKEITAIERLSACINESITKLQQYRTTLISAAVTGKIDVRKEASG